MFVRLLTDRAGGNGFIQLSGEIIEVSDRDGLSMLRRGQAEAVAPECAAVGPAETTSKQRPHFKRK